MSPRPITPRCARVGELLAGLQRDGRGGLSGPASRRRPARATSNVRGHPPDGHRRGTRCVRGPPPSGSYAHDQRRRIARQGWAGAVVAASISGWWVVLHLHTGAPVIGLTDQVLTVVSGGVGAGVLAVGRLSPGRHRRRARAGTASSRRRPGRTGRSRRPSSRPPSSCSRDLEGVDRVELDPLYTYVDPDLLADLRQQNDSQWRYLFRTDSYEVGVSSSGTVTAYEPPGNADVSTSLASR